MDAFSRQRGVLTVKLSREWTRGTICIREAARQGEEQAVEDALREVMRPSREEKGGLSFHGFRSMREARRFLKKVDPWLEQPREVTRRQRIA